MCYSAQIWQSYQRYVRAWGADISITEFVELYWLRAQNPKIFVTRRKEGAGG